MRTVTKEELNNILEKSKDGEKADLSGANLIWADLIGANLSGANLSGANLSGAKGIFVTGPHGSRGDFLYSVQHESRIMFKAGCRWCGVDELLEAVAKQHGDSLYGREYKAAISCHVSIAEARGWKVKE